MTNVYRSWRDVSEKYGNTIYKCFANLGIFEKIFTKLSAESNFSELSIDSTYVTGGAKKCLAIGKVVSVKLAVDVQGKSRKIILTAGNVNDCDVACELNFNLQGKAIIADRAYSKYQKFYRKLQLPYSSKI